MEDLATEFNGLLAQHLECGQYFDIDVTAAKNAKRFHISLAKEKLNKHPAAVIGLHVVVNFEQAEILANTQWGDDSVAQCDASEILKGDIKVNIHMLDTSFQISINGEHKLQMFYRDAIKHLKAIQIGGDVKFIRRVDHRQTYPCVWPPSSYIPYFPTPLSFSNDIPIRFKPGHLMVITARCYGQPTEHFFINLKHGHNETQIMHLKIKFEDKTISCHSCVPARGRQYFAHDYVDHETHGGLTFDYKKPLKIGIACKEKEFLIAINGQFFCAYAYRDPEIHLPNGVGRKPYTNVLSNIVGMKVFQHFALGVKITELDHIQLDNPECIHFEKYTKTDCACNETTPCSN